MRGRVCELEQRRVQAEPRRESQQVVRGVEIVAEHRMTDRPHVQPQLMRPPCPRVEPNSRARGARQALHDPPRRDARSAMLVINALARRIRRIFRNGKIDDAMLLRAVTAHKRFVLLAD